MPSPRPGAKVRGSTTGRPVMAALDLLGQRWTLRILWELREGPRTFRGLRDACGGVSPTVLNGRLAELREGGIVASGDSGYELTRLGRELGKALRPLGAWSERWAKALARGVPASD